ncbi:hypothetical protein NDU88_003752 [Pleurodeles waltl]|uniref:Uncharacterized protein n=1 Tax=Pleurodeles waltl TaxID=8319 RepID=A0AAV7LHY1_PLEWA|nr:hypothetical protein NDU88_003752 [Pleurodeles waltl]
MLLYPVKLKVIYDRRSHFFTTRRNLGLAEGLRRRLHPGVPGLGLRDNTQCGADPQRSSKGSSRWSRCSQSTARVMVQPDGTLSLEIRQQEREEPRVPVEAVTLVASSGTDSDLLEKHRCLSRKTVMSKRNIWVELTGAPGDDSAATHW